MVRKANTKSVATKRITRTKAEPKQVSRARPKVQFSTVELVLPPDVVKRAQATEFFINSLKPPFGQLSKAIDLKNADATRQFNLFFDRHPDDGSGLYSFTRDHGAAVAVMHQVVQGQAEAALELVIDTVRRGPKTIEFFSAANAMNPTGVTHNFAQGVDDRVRGEAPVSGVVVDRPAEVVHRTETRQQVPNLFHHDYPQLVEWLKGVTLDEQVFYAIKERVAQLVAASSQGGVITEEVMAHVRFSLARSGLEGVAQLQLFSAERLTSAPFGVIDLQTTWAPLTNGSLDERIAAVTGVRQNPFGPGPGAFAYGMDQRRLAGVWADASSPDGRDRAASCVSSGRGWAGAEALEAASFGNVGRRGPLPGMGHWTPPGHGPRGFAGYAPAGAPETFDVSTSSLGRFSASMQLLIDEQVNPMNKQYIGALLHKVQGAFYNQAASQVGSLLFSLQYLANGALWVTVRERVTQRSHFIENITLV